MYVDGFALFFCRMPGLKATTSTTICCRLSETFGSKTGPFFDVGHGQYLVYSSKASIFDECIIVFQVLVYKQILSLFEECIIVFQSPAQFPKYEDVSNTTLH